MGEKQFMNKREREREGERKSVLIMDSYDYKCHLRWRTQTCWTSVSPGTHKRTTTVKNIDFFTCSLYSLVKILGPIKYQFPKVGEKQRWITKENQEIRQGLGLVLVES